MRTKACATVLVAFIVALASSRHAEASWPIVTGKSTTRAPPQRIGLLAGIGSEAGFALGAQWMSAAVGLQVLAGYQPTYEVLMEGRVHSLPTGIQFRDGYAFAADALIPVFRDGSTYFGIQAGYRYSSLLQDGGSGGLFVHTQQPGWLAVGVSCSLSIYSHDGWLVPVPSFGRGSAAFGLGVTLALMMPRMRRHPAPATAEHAALP